MFTSGIVAQIPHAYTLAITFMSVSKFKPRCTLFLHLWKTGKEPQN